MFEAHTLDRSGVGWICSLKIWDVASVLDEVMSKCVVEAQAGPEGPNQVIVVK